MTIYTPKVGVAPGLVNAIQHGMRAAADPKQGITADLLNGYAKLLVIHWCGPTTDAGIDQDWDAGRGDGRIELQYDLGSGPPGRGLLVPANVDLGEVNIRMGVPLWVVGHADGMLVPLAAGLFHPLFTSATLDFWSPDTGRWLTRFYFCDPNQKFSGDEVKRTMVDQMDELVCRRAELCHPALALAPRLHR